MRVRNKWFTLILWTIIFTITVSLMIKIDNGKYQTPMEKGGALNEVVVEVGVDYGVYNTWNIKK